MKASSTARTIALRKLAVAPASALLVGPSGSGKRQAAREIANTLGVELRSVDLRELISPDIGESEKTIDALFAAAAWDGAVLLFEEADALFGRRTEVRDAHDRFANIEANHLLARIVAHPGVAIVTARRRDNLDPAVLRRLRAVIAFHPPPRAHE